MFAAVLEKDCEPHYFSKCDNAKKYLVDHNNIPDCKLEPSDNKDTCGELWDSTGISVGYYYTIEPEDEE